jgi:CrcB protein
MSRPTTQRVAQKVAVPLGCAVTSIGGALGALLRWALQHAFLTAPGHVPWVTLLINVVGSAALAAIPLLPVARRHPWVGVFLGTGALGGFTTMSAASVDTLTLLRGDHIALGSAYCAGTLAAALVAVLLVDRLTTPAERIEAEAEEWDE